MPLLSPCSEGMVATGDWRGWRTVAETVRGCCCCCCTASSRHRLSVGLMWPLSGLLGTAAPRCGTAAGQRRGWRLPRPPAISRETIAACYRSKAVRHSSAAASWVKKYRVGDAMMVMFRRLHIFLSCAIAAFRYYAVPSCWVESRPRRHHCPKLLKSRGSCIVLRHASFIH